MSIAHLPPLGCVLKPHALTDIACHQASTDASQAARSHGVDGSLLEVGS